ncbi:hypothetical protein SAMN05421870_10322 [Streptomyces qinglanensis]|uniref:Uncharacterized protein n=1 Tax=Streptomyces qinglanensis TaxID=943816 RepID=A0A1H9QNT6_9ACTN|nr:hypothetical protein SAMN05421870_10322 [Streptomyces qinglanensis]
MFAGRVEDPVVLEVAVRDERAELEDGFGVIVRDGVAYIAEDGQADYLPHAVAKVLTWA